MKKYLSQGWHTCPKCGKTEVLVTEMEFTHANGTQQLLRTFSCTASKRGLHVWHDFIPIPRAQREPPSDTNLSGLPMFSE